jgi:16S rRNA (guanine527-N7)-methyltransferase
MFHVKHTEAFHRALSKEPLAQQLDAQQASLMLAHWDLVKAWNERTNLTAIDDDSAAAQHHYADSLAALSHVAEGPVLDIGSGAGFPGIPLAIACPDTTFCLLEPRRKRVSFLMSSVARLGLTNVNVIHGRIQDPAPRLYALALTRATFSSPDDLRQCLSWLEPGGRFVAYRSADSSILHGAERQTYSVGRTSKALDLLTAPNEHSA